MGHRQWGRCKALAGQQSHQMEAWVQTGFSLAVLWFLMRAAETCATAVRSSTDGWEAAPASSGTPIGAVAHLPPVPLSFPPPAALPCPHLPTLHSFLPFSGACRALPLSPLFPKPFHHQFYTLPSFGLPFSLKLPHFPDPILLFLIPDKPIHKQVSVILPQDKSCCQLLNHLRLQFQLCSSKQSCRKHPTAIRPSQVQDF